jgi:sugar/nucleoside kinase (ribokinase family)
MLEVAHGMATSAAAAVARLGGTAHLIAHVGDDAAGARFVRDLTEAGVDCRHVRRVPGARSPLCTVLVDDAGERLVVPFYDPALGREVDWLPLAEIADADAALVDVRWPEGAAAVLDAARGAGIPAILDADVGPAEVVLSLARRASHAIFSEPCALAVTGAASAPEALLRLARDLDGFLAVTVGAEGCYWLERPDKIGHLRPPPVVAVDTLAAGDVFHGAFALALAEGMPLPRCIAFANAAAALKCRTFGGRLGTPERAEVDALLDAGCPTRAR